jgi:hypothetical protein
MNIEVVPTVDNQGISHSESIVDFDIGYDIVMDTSETCFGNALCACI